MMPGPEQVEQMLAEQQRLTHMMIEQQLADRRRVLAWSAILCSCDQRYVPGTPSWADCLVHGVFLVHPDGTIL
jgi:hypothetical protein